MKIKINLKITLALGALIFAVTGSSPAQVAISNTNNIDWSNPQNSEWNTGYNLGTTPYNVLSIPIIVGAGSQLTLDSISLYLGYGNGGDSSGNAPSPYMVLTDSGENNLGTSPAITLTTAYSYLSSDPSTFPTTGFYAISSQANAAPYWTTFTLASPVSLGAGTYSLDIWDTGQQLMYFGGGAVETSGVSSDEGFVDSGTYYDTTPAFAIAGHITTTATPEPSTFAFAALGVGVMGIAVLRRRSSKKCKSNIQ